LITRAEISNNTRRVHNILSHNVESDKLLFEDNSPETGFIILPDMKWDLETISSLYLVAIVHSHSIATLRDLTRKDIPMLKAIRHEAGRLVREKWGLEGVQSLRFYIHYQPSYCAPFAFSPLQPTEAFHMVKTIFTCILSMRTTLDSKVFV
jgi:Scavenger mRNA decapping enzyme C-term binding